MGTFSSAKKSQEEPRRTKKDILGWRMAESMGRKLIGVSVIISKKQAYVFVLWRARIEIICACAY